MNGTQHTFSVTEFAQLVRDQLARVFPTDVWIEGEVRGISRPASGHVYFDLVDPTVSSGQTADSLISVVLMKTTRQIVNRQVKAAGGGVRIDDGVHLRIRCAPDFYPPRGQFQLRMNGIDPSYTLGRLVLARDQLIRKLAVQGLVDANKALQLVTAPRRIGLVTAEGSAAAADFLDELARSGIAWDVVLASTPVQGDGAAARIAAAIRACEQRNVDVIAVVRGGGARTDLVVFDHEHVARAIAQCTVPVLTGIGHEVDVSVADEVSHLALKTPTACASHLVALVSEATARAEELWAGIVRSADSFVARHAETVASAATAAKRVGLAALSLADRQNLDKARSTRHLVTRQLERHSASLEGTTTALRLHSTHWIRQATDRASDVSDATTRLSRRRLAAAERHVDHLDAQRRLLDPAHVLSRGWSITTTGDGQVVRSIDDVESGAGLVTRVGDGLIASTVDSAQANPNPGDQTLSDLPEDDNDELGYADAMAELEEILEQLDDDAVDVDVLSARVERAAELIRFCRERIRDARLSVESIVAELDELSDPDADDTN